MKTPMLEALIYTGNEMMRKQLTVFWDIDEIIEVRVNFACNYQTHEEGLDLPLNRYGTQLLAA